MRKKPKRLAALLLSLLMVISMIPTTGLTVEAATKPILAKKSVSIVISGTSKIKVKNAPKGAKITYKSAKKSIATVSKQGKVKGLKSGTTKITVSVKKSSKTTKLTYKVTVKKPKLSKSKLSLKSGNTARLSVKNKPKKAQYTWQSNNPKVATVNRNGKVVTKAKGTANIKVKVKTAKKTYSLSCKVTVKPTSDTPTTPTDIKQTCTVTFDSNGGSAVASQTVEKNAQVTQPADPTRNGYTFGGWYTAASGGQKFDFNTAITENLTLYAHWSEVSGVVPPPVPATTYTITFDSNGGSSVASQTVDKNTLATQPTDPTRNGYTFGGWYTAASGGQKFDFNTAITGNITLYAHWNIFIEEDVNPTYENKIQEVENIASLNNGDVPYSNSDENGIPNYIDGTFSGKKVTSVEDAITALNDIHYTMQFENAEQEFKGVSSESAIDTNFYRLQQVYHNIPVYGYQLIVSTDKEGTIQTLNGHYLPDIHIETTPSLSAEDARSIIQANDDSDIISEELYIYAEEESSLFSLVWEIKTFTHNYFVEANTGEIINSISSVYDISENGSGQDLAGNIVSFPVDHVNDSYNLSDIIRNISVNDSRNQTLSYGNLIRSNEISDWSGYESAISAYANTIKTYDFYANILGRDSANDSHKKIHLAMNFRTKNEPWENAAYFGSITDRTFIGFGNTHNYSQCLDVVAHEYTHAVSEEIINNLTGTSDGLIYLNESGALNEAYSDILGELIENGTLDKIAEDLDTYSNVTDESKRCMRNFATPESCGKPSKVDNHVAYCYKNGDHDDHGCDNGGVHYNSSIINHAAYLIDQNWPTINHTNELATLFYKSIYYLAPNSTFLDCRYAVLAAAKSMHMDDAKRETVANSFKEVGIYHEDEEAWASAHHIIGIVKDAKTNSPIIDAQVIAVATKGLGGGIGYTDGRGNYDVKVNRAEYTVSVFADGYRSFKVENVDLTSWTNMNQYMETIYLTPAAWGDDTQNIYASGIITNALTGEPLEGVTIKFRNNSNNTSGEYVQTVAGLDIELLTDSSGQYYTAALPAGNYTLEASKNGFIVGYKDIVSGNSDISNNQNLSLSPLLSDDEIRIILTWGSNPRDLDSHVVGTLSTGENFHVYYNYESQYDNDINVCNLDHDDTQGNGMETITLNPTSTKPYYYYVYRYAGSGSISTSEAQVKVYSGSNLIATYNAPTDQGSNDYWNVFAIVDGQFIMRNTITSSSETNYASLEAHTFDLTRSTIPEIDTFAEDNVVKIYAPNDSISGNFLKSDDKADMTDDEPNKNSNEIFGSDADLKST